MNLLKHAFNVIVFLAFGSKNKERENEQLLSVKKVRSILFDKCSSTHDCSGKFALKADNYPELADNYPE